MEKVKGLVNKTKEWTSKNSPQLLTGAGIAGLIYSGVSAAGKTPKGVDILRDETEIAGRELDRVEKIKACWKVYAPEALIAALSVGCIVGANRISARRTTAMAAAYKLTEAAFKEFKDKTIEVVSEKNLNDIREGIAKDRLEKEPVEEKKVVVCNAPSENDVLFCDSLSMRYFKMNKENVLKAENQLNLLLRNEGYTSVNAFYDLLECGLEHTELGGMLGWNVDDGYVEIIQTAVMSKDGRPCVYLDFNELPRYDFDKFDY